MGKRWYLPSDNHSKRTERINKNDQLTPDDRRTLARNQIDIIKAEARTARQWATRNGRPPGPR